MSEKKHKSGYDILKERVAELENDAAFYRSQYREVSKERDRLKEELSMQSVPDFETFKRVERERDEWKAKWQQADAAKQDAVDKYSRLGTNYDDVIRALKIANQKLAFLLAHCPFWVRWLYRKQFEKGGN